jgi:hypothetical protein
MAGLDSEFRRHAARRIQIVQRYDYNRISVLIVADAQAPSAEVIVAEKTLRLGCNSIGPFAICDSWFVIEKRRFPHLVHLSL